MAEVLSKRLRILHHLLRSWPGWATTSRMKAHVSHNERIMAFLFSSERAGRESKPTPQQALPLDPQGPSTTRASPLPDRRP